MTTTKNTTAAELKEIAEFCKATRVVINESEFGNDGKFYFLTEADREHFKRYIPMDKVSFAGETKGNYYTIGLSF